LEDSATIFTIVTRPNCSLTNKGRMQVVLAIASFSLLVAFGFSLAGAWLVLPFAGLELLALAYAFYYVGCHADDYESITIDGEYLAVEKRFYKNTSQIVFQRYWARVLLQELPGGEQTLLLRSHGKEVEFGRKYMSNAQRVALAKQLKKHVGAVI
jgi:uncharacterized membrane protein